jgi:ADP-ribosylglycohydrolase
VRQSAEGRMAETKEALLAVRQGPGTRGGFAPEVLRASVYFVGSSSSFSEALQQSLTFAGPANYCPVLGGAIAGARWGYTAIPASALPYVEILGRAESCAHGLAAGWGMT